VIGINPIAQQKQRKPSLVSTRKKRYVNIFMHKQLTAIKGRTVKIVTTKSRSNCCCL